ncbi:MAG: transcription antitermination factor NusB [Sphaerospermopsis kisseleviana]|jgi:N utilization substance protein B|uniref:Transcription antitermination protein NusB n=2 Tax=Sphaerospermopsis TaxID=752201 RepID=A0ABR9VBB0_9CYAN|nr:MULTISPECIES: transcription antitermination factor NusB [Sphaerospermopsis]BAZ81329.1 NusB antitermination factor [Sphaerospermopsis kisseleviana NIES-73]MBD2135745.1 transcription antitermination protein NusB [Sphaerospermopsis sp. FACHB-1094]MBD2146128.1 transcription antitermination protein NusB [Sphaerospermopsis sp. FACHB-1194]MBE9235753.1 transcription antitermination protein NusB [Sphaerospermopsis aphanizomenoides LEGE 00250]MDB9440075.1 transcription antitermination factor NusB [Sp
MQRRKPQQIARELALLSLSQLPVNPKKLEKLPDEQLVAKLVLGAVRTLTTEVQDTLNSAAAELQRSNDRLLTSQTRASDLNTARTMLQEAITCTQTAINQLGTAVDFPELIQLANQDKEVRNYAKEIVITVDENRNVIDQIISGALVDWQVTRLAQIDRDILQIAVAEMNFMAVPASIAINEAVELAKRYSGDDGHRFINGVLRRVTEQKQIA